VSDLCKSVGDTSKPEIPLKCTLSSSSVKGKTGIFRNERKPVMVIVLRILRNIEAYTGIYSYCVSKM